MFDTICLRLTRTEVGNIDFTQSLSPNLSNVSTRKPHDRNKNISVSANLDNLKFYITPFSFHLWAGSMCKWYLGNNYNTLTCNDTQQAIEKLSDMLHLPFSKAVVTRVDFGLTMCVNEPILNYLNHLGPMFKANRLPCATSVTYNWHSQNEVACFYDKNREQRAHRDIIPDRYIDHNVLRYEYRILHRVSKYLNCNEVTSARLYEPNFFNLMLDRWHDVYHRIKKVNDMDIDFNWIKNMNDFNRISRLSFIKQCGGQERLLQQIAEAQRRGEINNKKAQRFRDCINETCKIHDSIVYPNRAIIELDGLIDNAVESHKV